MRPGGVAAPSVAGGGGEGAGDATDANLDEYQDAALAEVMGGANRFITGRAGVGKSFIVKRIVTELEDRQRKVAVTASTGAGAVIIGGCTVHSFAGIELGKGTKEELATKVLSNHYARKRWREYDVLLLDEISMVDDDLLAKLNYVARRCRNQTEGGLHPEPFGGMQLILSGDFFQLPPVVRGGGHVFAFEGATWVELNLLTVELLKVSFKRNRVLGL